MDPKAMFQAISLSRLQIADNLEYYRRDDVNLDYLPDVKITSEDPRLTDELCQEYASQMGDLYDEAMFHHEDWFLEGQNNVAKAILEKMGYTKIEQETE